MSDSRTFGLTFKEVLLIDSTTIHLFSDILKGVGRNPKNDGKNKGGIKSSYTHSATTAEYDSKKNCTSRINMKNHKPPPNQLQMSLSF